jgi:hypothetical protein
MIRKVIHIFIIIAGFVLLTSKSCVPEAGVDQETRLRAEQDLTRRNPG